jgi:YD repeat-containing protein
MKRAISRFLLSIFLAAGGVVLSAHVTVQPKEVPVKSLQEFLVRVPTEKDQPTTAVRLVFPEGFELLRVRPTAGWKCEFERDADGRIVAAAWSGGSISRNEYEVFSFMARSQSPGVVKIEAYQTYGEHDVVAWVNAAEPRPAPQITVLPAGSNPAAPAADPFAPPMVGGDPTRPVSANPSTTPSVLGGAALLVALAALAMSWQATRRSRL